MKMIPNTSVVATAHYCVNVYASLSAADGFAESDYGKCGASWENWIGHSTRDLGLKHVTVHANSANHAEVLKMLEDDPHVIRFALVGLGPAHSLDQEAWRAAAVLVR